MWILFTGVFLFKWIRSFQHPQDQVSVLLNVVCFIHPSCLCFSHPPTLFLQGFRFLNQVSILFMWSLFFLFNQCSYPVILMKILTELQVYHSLFFYLLRWNQVKLCGSYPFSLFQIPFLTGAPLYHSPLAIHLFRSAEDISKIRISTLHSFKFFWGCYLFQAI